ncbi:MAG: efflux RND transporter permease subunit [Wenzhouxiangellaceae bacterium]
MLRQWFRAPLYGGLIGMVLAMLSLIAVIKLPVALLPDLSQPELTIETPWPGHNAEEVLLEIIDRQEHELRGLPYLQQITSTAYNYSGSVNLRFKYGTDMNDAYMYTLQALNRIPDLPADVRPAVIERSGERQRMAFVFLRTTHAERPDIDRYQSVLEKQILPLIQSVEGVSHTKIFLASEAELQVHIDLHKLNAYGLSLDDIIAAIGQNHDESLGALKIGKHQYQLAYQGKVSVDSLAQKVINSDTSVNYRLGDVATITQGRSQKRHFVLQNGYPAIGIDIYKTDKANLLESLDRLYEVIEQLNRTELSQLQLSIEKSFDATVFIRRAIELVSSNLILGSLLSGLLLIFFWRHATVVFVIFLTIPATIGLVLIVLYMSGHTLNVISLAAIALSSGVILDAAIVVSDAIQKQYSSCLDMHQAIVMGLKSVWRALVASTATSLVIFMPLLYLQGFEASLFSDLAIAMTLSIVFSLLVSVFFLPLIYKRWPSLLEQRRGQNWLASWSTILSNVSVDHVGRWPVLLAIFGGVIVAIFLLRPDMDLLPPVKRDVVDNILFFSGMNNLDVIEEEVGQTIVMRLAPHLKREKQPYINNYYLAVSPSFTSLGVRPLAKEDTRQLTELIRTEILSGLPGVEFLTYQAGIFGQLRSSRTVTILVYADDVAKAQQGAAAIKQFVLEQNPDLAVQVTPAASASVPQIMIQPRRDLLAINNVSEQTLRQLLQMSGSGLYLGRLNEYGGLLDIRLKTEGVHNVDGIKSLPVGRAGLQLADLVDFETRAMQSEIQKINFRLATSVTVNVPDHMSIESVSMLAQQAIDQVNGTLLQGREQARLSGSSDLLADALHNLMTMLAFSAILFFIILFLAYGSLANTIITILCLPLTFVGGLASLWLLRLFVPQQLDLLTMIGFMILSGLVINNAILFVEAYTVAYEGDPLQAVRQAYVKRMRPIVMSTTTTVIAIVPLALVPGAGNELYRGLGAVVAGGLLLGGLALLFVIPALLAAWHGRQPLNQMNDGEKT